MCLDLSHTKTCLLMGGGEIHHLQIPRKCVHSKAMRTKSLVMGTVPPASYRSHSMYAAYHQPPIGLTVCVQHHQPPIGLIVCVQHTTSSYRSHSMCAASPASYRPHSMCAASPASYRPHSMCAVLPASYRPHSMCAAYHQLL